VIKSKRMRCAGLVARMGRGVVFTGIWFGFPILRCYSEELIIYGRVTLKGNLGRYGKMGRAEFSWPI